jgi:magnesium transporter
VSCAQSNPLDESFGGENAPNEHARTATVTQPGRLIDNAVYCDGRRIASPSTLAETYVMLRETHEGMAWIGLYRADNDQLSSLAREFQLHELAVDDAVRAHQRPKLERYGPTLFVVLRTARYLDATEELEFGEVHVFVGPDFVLTIRHSEAPDLARVRQRLEHEPGLLRHGPEAVLYGILDEVVDAYRPVVDGVENDVEEIEVQVFGGDPGVSRRIYELTREVLEFQRVTRPLHGVVTGLIGGFDKYGIDDELRNYLRDVADHLTQIVDRLDALRQLLQNILAVNATLVAQQQSSEMQALTEASYAQNEEVKRVSAWAAILFAPTLIGTIYGMNFETMPELDWFFGYPIALMLMVLTCVTLYTAFKRRNWL